jgi:hypothetical protein
MIDNLAVLFACLGMIVVAWRLRQYERARRAEREAASQAGEA